MLQELMGKEEGAGTDSLARRKRVRPTKRPTICWSFIKGRELERRRSISRRGLYLYKHKSDASKPPRHVQATRHALDSALRRDIHKPSILGSAVLLSSSFLCFFFFSSLFASFALYSSRSRPQPLPLFVASPSLTLCHCCSRRTGKKLPLTRSL